MAIAPLDAVDVTAHRDRVRPFAVCAEEMIIGLAVCDIAGDLAAMVRQGMMASAFGMATSDCLGGFAFGRLRHCMRHFFRTLLAGKHVAAVHGRMAAVVGAVALGLVAIAFARMGEVAQKLFLELVVMSDF